MLHQSEPEVLAARLPQRETYLSARSRPLVLGLLLIVGVAILGLVLSLQGWKSRPPAFDMITYFNSADNLLRRGMLPAYGDISSYGSFSPPGTAWLMAPGMLVFNDPRLDEKLGSAVLHLGTLLGIFLLARETLGLACAYLSVVVYGLSGLGLAFAGSLWPIGHPFFYVWLIFFAIRWVTRQEPRYLAWALAILAVGMYDDLAIAPSALILPILWIVYRPPLFSKQLFVVGGVALAVWYPYLQFGAARGFADLKSQFLLQNIFPASYQSAWCNPNLTLKTVAEPSAPSASTSTLSPLSSIGGPSNIFMRIVARAHAIWDGLLANFNEVTQFPALALVLLLSLLSGIAGLGVLTPHVARSRLVPARLAAATQHPHNSGTEKKVEVLLLGLLVPWAVLLIVAEPGRPERFFWLWPLQVLFLAAFTTHVLPRFGVARPVVRISQALLIITLLATPFLISRVNAWRSSGWAGTDASEIQVVDYVANRLSAAGQDRAAIGYHIFIYPFMASYNVVNPEYKVGAELDLLFRERRSIANTDTCAEGVSPADEYRIVRTTPMAEAWAPREYFNVPLDADFHLMRQFGPYQVFKRGA